MSTTSFLVVVMILAMGITRSERVNKTASLAPLWSSSEKEEVDLLTWNDDDLSGDPPSRRKEDNQLDGGFSSLDGMLNWAIGHSDPAKLKEAVLDVESISPDELKQRQMEIKELLEKLKMPSDAKLMKIAIDDLNNISLPLEDRHRALQELLILVEPIDNANDLHKLGGLTAVIRDLNNSNPEIRTISAWIIGKASQNNPFVQHQVLELGTLAKLMEMARSDSIEEATKALYAISALIKNNLEGQELFYTEAGGLMLQNILSNSSVDIRLHRKSVSLLADLIQGQLDPNTELPLLSSHSLLKSVVDLLASSDLDLQEKALYAIKHLLLLRSADALVFKEVCRLDVALEKMKQQLQKLIVEDQFKEYAMDVETLRKEVELIFLGKLDDKVRGPVMGFL